MNPYVAAIRPNAPSPREAARLLPAGRALAAVLRRELRLKVIATSQKGALLLVACGSRQVSEDERVAVTATVQAACDEMFSVGAFVVKGATKLNTADLT